MIYTYGIIIPQKNDKDPFDRLVIKKSFDHELTEKEILELEQYYERLFHVDVVFVGKQIQVTE